MITVKLFGVISSGKFEVSKKNKKSIIEKSIDIYVDDSSTITIIVAVMSAPTCEGLNLGRIHEIVPIFSNFKRDACLLPQLPQPAGDPERRHDALQVLHVSVCPRDPRAGVLFRYINFQNTNYYDNSNIFTISTLNLLIIVTALNATSYNR